jgi:dipeptidyl aminopeptidase/acylaminoacyl peptidase
MRVGRDLLFCTTALIAMACGGRSVGSDDGAGGSGGSGNPGAPAPLPSSACGEEWFADNFVVFDSNLDGIHRDIYAFVGGHEPEVINVTNTPDVDETDPDGSPDGLRLLYVVNGERIELWEAESGTTTLALGQQPTWSPDGKEIAFRRGASVFRLPLGGTPIEVIRGPDELNGYAHPVYSPDGQYLVMDRGNQISVTRLDGSDERFIVANWTTSIRAPDISPSGALVVSSIQCKTQFSLWVSSFGQSTTPCQGTALTSDGSPHARQPSWGSHDVVAYELGDQPAEIAMVDMKRRSSCLIRTAGDDRNPSWVTMSTSLVPITEASR